MLHSKSDSPWTRPGRQRACVSVGAGLQPILHVALRIVPPAQLVSFHSDHLVRQVLQQMVEQSCVACISRPGCTHSPADQEGLSPGILLPLVQKTHVSV